MGCVGLWSLGSQGLPSSLPSPAQEGWHSSHWSTFQVNLWGSKKGTKTVPRWPRPRPAGQSSSPRAHLSPCVLLRPSSSAPALACLTLSCFFPLPKLPSASSQASLPPATSETLFACLTHTDMACNLTLGPQPLPWQVHSESRLMTCMRSPHTSLQPPCTYTSSAQGLGGRTCLHTTFLNQSGFSVCILSVCS